MSEDKILLKLVDIDKSFGGIHALRQINLEVKQGQVHSIVGENGAGKSTMMKIISGVISPSAGSILFENKPVTLKNPKDAFELGIVMVHQEPSVFSELSVIENLFSGNEIKSPLGNINWQKTYEEGTKMLHLVGLDQSYLQLKMGDLSLGTQQLLLIAKGLYYKSKLIILDEPTSILSGAESEKLFSLIEDLKSKRISVLYISHRIPEILQISDKVTVLRDGQITEDLDPSTMTEDKIIAAMSGRTINRNVYVPPTQSEMEEVIRVEHLTKSPYFKDISFSVNSGEVVGMYGLIGAGRSEIARTIFGEMKRDGGTVYFKGDKLKDSYPTKFAIKKGIYYVPEDRGNQGIFKLHSLKYNLTSSFLDSVSNSLGFLNLKKETNMVDEQIKKYSIKVSNQQQLITSLSGGSQQKVIIARWLLNKPDLLILDEPTRGIDMRTKLEIHELIMKIAREGISVLLISSDMPEIIGLSDRILTLNKGKIIGNTKRNDVSEDQILRMALGLTKAENLKI
ncbi:sugar ABC transporter ATP-binding protein [Sporolactobacillus kofuensis]|uniref:Sugar ABC transporter ATP-binding protein n=1 Tax=Sporolactobacillus kofuensis TaxID=269672 RepID=A0ABW1WCM2_9BACL|nr:sugar ABC transporter ATP-binding protein [Sporolactobacillus kofuensis]MCO7174822.1 sugar ABC transporter ATP-binding protein [Sporolactobacillus kofuensis]